MALVVDSSVWIGLLRDQRTEATALLRSQQPLGSVLVGDLILGEVLMGARDERHAARLERLLRAFPVVSVVGEAVATQAARNYRLLRARGVTVRKTVDLLIGTYCCMHGHALLHDDRDFEPMAAHLGLSLLPHRGAAAP